MATTQKKIHEMISAKDRVIIQYACQGLTDREIAEELGLSVHTVVTYWARMRSKLKARSKAAIVHMITQSEYEQRIIECRAESNFVPSESGVTSKFSKRLATRLNPSHAANTMNEKYKQIEGTMARLGAYSYSGTIDEFLSCEFLSESATQFGLDRQAILSGDSSILATYHPDDLSQILSAFRDSDFKNDHRFFEICRVVTPTATRTVLVVSKVLDGNKTEAIVIDVQPLVNSGAIPNDIVLIRESDHMCSTSS